MGLSRLDNFLKSVKGNILYVDPNSIDSTDSIENQGNSPTRPFKTLQRALAEAARFSYQVGNNNDRFNKTTIILEPGDHIVDNRPGLIIDDDGNYLFRSGQIGDPEFVEWSAVTNFNIFSLTNALYKLNSIHGGIIVPRGTSIVGRDLRKTNVIPRFVPNPDNNNIERSAVFRLTGACFVFGFTILDADINGICFKDYTSTQFVPNFSHHKLTVFEFADGANNVRIDDTFISDLSTNRTDLDMYYEKIALVYGQNSGRNIVDPVYSTTVDVDIQTKVDEYRIVGSKGLEVGITSISASGTEVTVTLDEELDELSVNSPIQISGVISVGVGDIYNGKYVITEVVNSNTIKYSTTVENQDTNPNTGAATLNFVIDTVTSASPYVFNCSLRSVYGMCGLHADGSKVTGFKSMVVAQYTGIGLQKDSDAFVRYNTNSGTYQDTISISNIESNSLSKFKPEYENYHIKASNDAFIQVVSVFAIGYAKHFVAESGGDISITNSNSNFGARALEAVGFKNTAFTKDDVGYITHIVSPLNIPNESKTVEFLSIDVGLTTSVSSGAGTTTKLYLAEKTDENDPPQSIIDGYRVGAKTNDALFVELAVSGITSEYSSRIILENSDLSREKTYDVTKASNGIENNIIQSSGIIVLSESHTFLSGEKVRVVSDNGRMPDGIDAESIYYIINSSSSPGLGTTEIKLAQTFNNAISNIPITPNKKGGNLKIVSRVSDKISGDVGHPIQYDSTNSNWYINVSTSNNGIYDAILANGTSNLGNTTPRTYLMRTLNSRSLDDSIYKIRYVVPKNAPITSRPPLQGFVLQESNSTSLTSTEQDIYFDSINTLTTSEELRNPGFIADAEWAAGVATIYTELPHKLSVGSEVRIENVTSGLNTTTNNNAGYNGIFTVSGVTNSKIFTYNLELNPGDFQNDTTIRDLSLPRYSQVRLKNNYQIYKSEEIAPYIPQKEDGVYHLYVINNSNKPSISPFNEIELSQPIENLYPKVNRDNVNSDPDASVCSASNNIIGVVNINDSENSITKETVQKSLNDFQSGFKINSIISTSGTAHTIFTEYDHNLSAISVLTIDNAGSGYVGPAEYYGVNLVGYAGSAVGSNANAKITVDGSGSVTNVVIMDSGGNYGIGNTMQLIPAAGIGTTAGTSYATVSVTNVTNNIGDTIEITGISPEYSQYNTLYKVVGISTLNSKLISVESANTISNHSTDLIASSNFNNSLASYTGKELSVSAISYNSTTGVGIVTFSSAHGLLVGNSVLFGGFNESFFNKTVSVTNVSGLTIASFDFGLNDSPITPTGSGTGYIHGYTSRNGDFESENSSGRLIYSYGGIQSTLSQELTSSFIENDELQILNAASSGFRKGDYVMVNSEIFRISEFVTLDAVSVFRSLLGSPRQTHSSGAVVRKINILPVELRRNSTIRASGHTFEYVGFGPGNYSTAFPERQDRILTFDEDRLSRFINIGGGIVDTTGMDNNGDFAIGNKKLNSSTGREEIFGLPIPQKTGEEINRSLGYDLKEASDFIAERSIIVNGGPNNNILSEFNGPVIFNEKVTTSKSLETKNLFIQGDANVSRRITVGISQPTVSGNYGDVTFRTEPSYGDSVGWVYTLENRWEPWGKVGLGNRYTSNALSAGVLTADYTEGTIARTTDTSLITINITNVPTYDGREYEYKVILNAAGALSNNLTNLNIQINGSFVTVDVNWKDGVSPSGTSAGYYVFDLNILRVGTDWEIMGDFSIYS